MLKTNSVILFAASTIVVIAGVCGVYIWMQQPAPEYLVSLARFDPPFGIAGTDPMALHESIKKLAKVQRKLAYRQETFRGGYYIYSALFPIRFLSTLTDLEEARIALIKHPTLLSARAYRRALARIRTSGVAAADRFATTLYAAWAQENEFKFFGLEGKVTSTSLHEASRQIQQRMRDVAHRIQEIETCLAARTCPSVPSPLQHTLAPMSAPSHVIRNAPVENFLNRALGNSVGITVSLASSTCLSTLASPYMLRIRSMSTGEVHVMAVYDLLFYKTGEGRLGPIQRYLQEHDVDYILFHPLNYYMCPSTQHDRGMALTLEDIMSTFPNLNVENGDILSEAAARHAIENKYRTTADSDIRRTLEEFLLAFEERSARFDTLITTIERDLSQKLITTRSGLPADLSTRQLLAQYSAFPSLLLAHNSDAGLNTVIYTSLDPGAMERFFNVVETFESLKGQVGEEKIVHDVQWLHERENPPLP